MQAKNRPGQDSRRWHQARFTKTAELEQKEARYREAVEAIQEYNEKHAERTQECRFDWEALDEWTAEKVAQEAERFTGAASIVMITPQSEVATGSPSQIGERVKNLYAIDLPEALLKGFEERMCKGKLKPERAMEIVENAIQDFEARGPRWCEGNGDGLSGSYRRSEGCLRSGDMIVRKTSGPDGQMYKAYLVTKDGSEKYLGCDEDIPAVKERARLFYIFNNVAAKLKLEAGLAKVNDQVQSKVMDRRGVGLDY